MANPQERLKSIIQEINEPHINELLSEILVTYDQKLWHQLTGQLQQLVDEPAFNEGKFLLAIYEQFISNFQEKIKDLSLIQMIVKISKQVDDVKERITFLQKSENVKERDQASYVFLICKMGILYLEVEDYDKCKQIFDEAEDILEQLSGIDPTVHASYHYFSAQYQKIKGTAGEFYNSMLLYLAYTQIDQVPEAERQETAFNLCVSALIGDEVFNFGELLSHPIINSLDNTDQQWIAEILHAFNQGDLKTYNELKVTYKEQLSSQQSLVRNSDLMEEKIDLLSLMELVFTKEAHDRVIPFEEIAESAQCSIEKVEILLMRALSLNLINGLIDEVDNSVTITWVQPRVLTKDQIVTIKDRITSWAERVSDLSNLIRDETPELFEKEFA
eukprot:TRINITY_DN813_c0_g1_i2.p1 TRINITY_DN813_c0_g1~~TRINITY_DN813_c0_g1_i2.p1  ORF type:complete len:388 (-),score=128.42 TRINITY_DN813_c0_g1_i2:120-1283(-)